MLVQVQTPCWRRVFCAGCGHRARSKGRREGLLRDAPSAGRRPQKVVWDKRIWACPDAWCDVSSRTGRAWLAGLRRVLTGRVVRWVVDRQGADEGSVASLARKLGIGWSTAWTQVAAVANQIAVDPHRVGPGDLRLHERHHALLWFCINCQNMPRILVAQHRER